MDQVKIKYGFHKVLKDISYDSAVQKVKNVILEHGFRVLCEIDTKRNIQDNLNLYFNNYTILGVCNPNLAYKALKAEYEIGLLLPCNIIIYESENGVTVASINPEVYDQVIDNTEIKPIMMEIKSKLMQIIEDL